MNIKHLIPRGAAKLLTAACMLGSAAFAAEYPGWVKIEYFDGITGTLVSDLQNAAKYQADDPDAIEYVQTLYIDRAGDINDYGARASGYIVPSEDGDYVFYVASDDSSSFYLSTDASPANLKLVAADQGWQNARTWTGPGGTSSGEGTVDVVFRRGVDPGDAVLQGNGFQWVGPFQNRSDQFLTSPLEDLAPEGERWPNVDAQGNAVISLQANQKYYFEYLLKEGGGGDFGGVAWKKVGDPDPENGSSAEISSLNLSVDAPEEVVFLSQPQSLTVQEGQIATFTVSAIGPPGDTDPFFYTFEWFADGEPILDAPNGPTYSITSPTVADSGKEITVRVTTSFGLIATTTPVTLTVINDDIPPEIVNIRSNDNMVNAKITFSEAVRNEAVDPANYTISGGLTVTDAYFDIVVDDPLLPEDPKNPVNPLNRAAVILFTSEQEEGETYNVTVNNVQDLIGHDLVDDTATLYASVFQSGILNYKRWEGGNNIDVLVEDVLRYADPTVVGTRTVLETGGEGATYVAGTYVDRVSGFFVPQTTGEYVFYISADNDGYLFLSTDADPANRKLIAADVGWQNTREWTGPGGDTDKRRGDRVGGGPFENRSDQMLTSQRAVNGEGRLAGLLAGDGVDPEPWPTVNANGNAVITLQAGQRYAVELWHVEGDSGRAEATFKLASEADPANGTVSRASGAWIGALVDPSSLLPMITTQPVGVNFTAGDDLNFSVVANSVLPLTYQWFKNGVAIEGATSSTLSIDNADADDFGAYHVTVTNENGVTTSAQALALTEVEAPGLGFKQDSSGMVVIEAENYFDAQAANDGHIWVPLAGRAGFSGTGYMAALPDSGVNFGTDFVGNSARLDFKIDFSAAGTHYIWLRGGDPVGNGSGDSVHAGINGASAASATRIDGTPGFNIATGWNWVGNIQGDTRAMIEVPSAGEHTFSLWMREDGFVVDKIILTTDAAFTPTDMGPAESEQIGGGDTPDIGISVNASGDIVITYTGTLEASTTVDGDYETVQGASGGTYTVDPTGDHRFFRSAE